MKRSSASKTTSHDHAVAIAGETVTSRTKDLISFPTTSDCLLRDCQRKLFDVVRITCLLPTWSWTCGSCSGSGCGLVFLTGKERLVRSQKTAGNSSRHWGTRREAVAEKRSRTKRFHPWLILHVLAAARCEQ